MNVASTPAAPWRSALTALALAALITTGLMSPAVGAPAPTAPTSPVDLTLTEITPEVMRVEEELSFRGSINNESDQLLENITLWFRMQTLIPSDAGLTEWLAGTSENNILTMARLDLPITVSARDSARYTFEIPPESFPFDSGSDWGPRGIELIAVGHLVSGSTSERVSSSVRSTVFWLPDSSLAAPLTVVAPLTPTQSEWGSAVDTGTPVATTAVPRIGDITSILEGRVDTWGFDAALLDAAPILTDPLGLLIEEDRGDMADSAAATPEETSPSSEDDSTSPGSPATDDYGFESVAPVITKAIGVATARGPIISLGWGRPDHPALMAAHANPAPTGAGPPGAGLLTASQNRAQELFVDNGISVNATVLWPGTTITPDVVEHLPSDITGVITPASDSTRGQGANGNSTYESSGRTLGMHAPHAGLSARLLRPSGDQAARSELLARAAIALRLAPTKPLLLALPGDLTAADAEHSARNLDLLHEAFGREGFGHQEESVMHPIMGPQPPGLLTEGDIAILAAALQTARDFGPLFADAAEFTLPLEAAVFTATSTTWRSPPELRGELIGALAGTTERMQSALTIEVPSTVNLISSGGELPVSVSSTMPTTLNARVELRPGDPRVQTVAAIAAAFEPHRTTSVRVPITAVGNGNIPMTIHLLGADGADIAEPQKFTMRVRADWETTGTAVFAGLVLIGFVFGLYRNITRAGKPKKAGQLRD